MRKYHFHGEEDCPLQGIEVEKKFVEYLKGLHGSKWPSIALSREMIEHIALESGNRCIYCGGLAEEVDHLDPVILGGEDSFKNSGASCKRCNSKKGDILFSDWLKKLKSPFIENCRKFYERRHERTPEAFVVGAPIIRKKRVSNQFVHIAKGGKFVRGRAWIELGHLPRDSQGGIVVEVSVEECLKNIDFKQLLERAQNVKLEKEEYPVICNAQIRYQDLDGKEETRNITTINLFYRDNGASGVNAFCHLRQDERSFMISRIVEFVDLDSGEIVEDIQNYLKIKAQQAA